MLSIAQSRKHLDTHLTKFAVKTEWSQEPLTPGETKERNKMAVLTFTPGDKMSAIRVDKGWYPVIIEKQEQKTAKESGKPMIVLTLKVTSGKFENKNQELVIHSGLKDTFAGMQPWNYFLVLSAAIQGKSLADVDMSVDTDTLTGKPFDAYFDLVTEEGTLKNLVTQVLPTGAAKPAF